MSSLSDLVASLPFDVRRLIQVPALRRVHEESLVRRLLALPRASFHEVRAVVVLQLAPPPPNGKRRTRPRLFLVDAAAPDRATLFEYMRSYKQLDVAWWMCPAEMSFKPWDKPVAYALTRALVQQPREVSLWVFDARGHAPGHRLLHHERLTASRRDAGALADELCGGVLKDLFSSP